MFEKFPYLLGLLASEKCDTDCVMTLQFHQQRIKLNHFGRSRLSCRRLIPRFWFD